MSQIIILDYRSTLALIFITFYIIFSKLVDAQLLYFIMTLTEELKFLRK